MKGRACAWCGKTGGAFAYAVPSPEDAARMTSRYLHLKCVAKWIAKYGAREGMK